MFDMSVVPNFIIVSYIPLEIQFRMLFAYKSYIIVNNVCVPSRGRKINDSILDTNFLN